MNPHSRFAVPGSRFVFTFRFGSRVRCVVLGSVFALAIGACSRTPAPAPDSAWVVGDDGAGIVRLGMTRGDLIAAGGVRGDGGGDCEFVRPESAPTGLLVMLVEGTVRSVDVSSTGIETVAGIGVGSTEEEVRKAYPWTRVQLHKYTSGHYLIIDIGGVDGTRRLIFETDGMRVTRYRVGRIPEVDWVEGCA